MTLIALFAGIAACTIAFANGANDNSKGVATLIGCGRVSARTGVLFGTLLTFLGSLAALLLAGELLSKFSGRGVIESETIMTVQFPMCIGIAAAATVLLATRLGIPISTTHALVGSFVGIGLASEIIWAGIWLSFLYPLLAAPVLAAVITLPVYLTFHQVRQRCGITRESCICISETQPQQALAGSQGMMRSVQSESITITAGRARDGHTSLCGSMIGVDAQRVLDWSHICTAGAVSFARGLNDAPKIAAILLLALVGADATGHAHDKFWPIMAVAIGMAAGGLLAAKRVTQTMSRRITGMNDGQAFTANLVTAGLVILASPLGLPVSTTHVSCGSLFGIGIANGTAHWKMITTILLAWMITLPVAGTIAYLMWQIIG